MTIETIDYLPVFHAVPILDSVVDGCQFFADEGPNPRHGTRGFVSTPFGNAMLASSMNIPCWRTFIVKEVFYTTNVVAKGPFTVGFHTGKKGKLDVFQTPVEPWGASLNPLVVPFVLQHGESPYVRCDELRLALATSILPIGGFISMLNSIAKRTREWNPTWQRDLDRCGRDLKINQAMSALEGLHMAVEVPLLLFGFAGEAICEFA